MIASYNFIQSLCQKKNIERTGLTCPVNPPKCNYFGRTCIEAVHTHRGNRTHIICMT